jgi:aminomethyltransferase
LSVLKESSLEKKTPLYAWHESHGGRMVPFGGYLLPVQYETGVIAEHNAVREKAGLFDVSHMGEFVIHGKDALENLQRIFTNDFRGMKNGRARYTLMCGDSGGVIDDLVVYKMEEGRCLLVVNAANREKDAAWIKERLRGEAAFEDLSDTLAQISLQGPAAGGILASVSSTIPEKYYTFIEQGRAAGIGCIVSRTGYTGEEGFELYCESRDAVPLWEKLLEAGKSAGLIPCGLGSRDTLRLEAGMPLYGHEMDEGTSPFEAGLAFAVKMDKPAFTGKEALAGKEKPHRVRTGIRITGKGIARENCAVLAEGKAVGKTTSGTYCPYLREALAMAIVETWAAAPGTALEVEVRGRKIEAAACALPFYTLK